MQRVDNSICRVAIIDDSPEDRYLMRRSLLRDVTTRYAFIEADTGRGGIALCLSTTDAPDCVLLDMRLPDMDGLQVLKALMRGAGELALPVVVLTGSDVNMATGRAALAAGAQDFQGKSWITAEGLSRAIANAIERFHLARRMRESEQRLSLAVQAAELGTWEITPEGTYLWSDRTRQLLGLDPASEPSLSLWLSRIHPQDRPQVEAALAAARKSGRYDTEYRVIHPDGSERWLADQGRVSVTAPRTDRLDVHAIGVVTDATERKRAEAALRDYAEQLKQADQRKNDFLATLAHELRNPLAPIRNAIELLKKPNLSPEHFTFAREISEHQLEVLVRLIDDLLDVSRISQGKIELKKERVALTTIIEQAVETAWPNIDEAGHTLKVSLPEETIYLDADRVRLAQVFGNLINNAAKYSERGGKIEIRAMLEPISNFGFRNADLSESEVRKPEIRNLNSQVEVVVSVVDQGIGILPEHLPRLFEMFSQVESALTRSKGGLGIGLSLVKGLVELHGGTVEAKSEGVGKGSEFVVRLPISSF